MILVTSPVSDFSVLMQTGSGRPATGRSDAAGLRHVLHAAAAQYRHSQEEAQHQTIQGSPIDAHLWHCFTFAFTSFSLRCLKKNLSYTWFQVVPFSQRSGVLEWCSGTVPIGEFLVEPNKGAHKRFRPQDWASLACRRKMLVWRCWQENTCNMATHACYGFRTHSCSFCWAVTAGRSETCIRREAAGLQRGVHEVQAGL